MGTVTALVLAAGESRRMGALKPLLPYGSETVIGAVVRSLAASPVDRILVVLGHRSEEIAAALAGTAACCVHNPRYREGMLTSVQAGVAAAPEDTDWFLIALGDQPAVGPAAVSLLVERARSAAGDPPPSLLVPVWNERRGHPLLVHAEYREEILVLPPEAGLRELLRRHAGRVLPVPVPDEAVLRDLDTPEEYRRELERLAASPPPTSLPPGSDPEAP